MCSIDFPMGSCDLFPMAKGPQILTANRLRDGTVLYWTGTGWTETMAGGAVFEDAGDAKSALDCAAGFVKAREIVNPYLFDVRIDEGVAVPVKEREIVRAAGPTVRRDLGKQAEGRYAPPPQHSQITRAETTPGEAKDPFDASV